jgi:pyrroline-5-carboxylate reductase
MKESDMPLEERKIAFIGGGHITEILITNLLRAKTLVSEQLLVSDPREIRLGELDSRFGVATTPNNREAVQWGDFTFINVLPQVASDVIAELAAPQLWKGKILVTLAAGITMERYMAISSKLPVVRALPNPPSKVGAGVIALCFNQHVKEAERKDILSFFAPMGVSFLMEENTINAVTSLSTPATIYLFFKSLIDGGIRSGLDKETSTKIVLKTIAGSLEMLKQEREELSELIEKASSPGGISEECLQTLDQYDFQTAVSEAVIKGTEKADSFSRT